MSYKRNNMLKSVLQCAFAMGILAGMSCTVSARPPGNSPQGPIGGVKLLLKPDGNSKNFSFGRDYLRIKAEYVYVPQVKNEVRGMTIKVATKNKSTLEFNLAIPTSSDGVYDNLGEWIIVPYVALNRKTPLEITQEVRTQRDRSSSYSWIPDMLTTVAGLLTGRLSTNISRLTEYTRTANNIVSAYDKHTERSLSNFFTISDDALGNSFTQMKNGELRWFSVFTDKNKRFHVSKQTSAGQSYKKQEKITINEPEGVRVERNTADDLPTRYRIETIPVTRNEKGNIQNEFVNNGNREPTESNPWYHPTGQDPYIILKFERYVPYPHLKDNPSSVPGVASHFDNLNKILKVNRLVTQAPTENTDKSVKKIIQDSVDTEGEELVKTLHVLTDAGDLSLADAHTIMSAFIGKAGKAFGESNFNSHYLTSINEFPFE